ncbi:DUF3592 domain-containing protein [Thalassotalea ganghwensis]
MSIQNRFINVALGKSRYSIYFLFLLMIIAPIALFTDYKWLDAIAWLMLITLGLFILATGLILRSLAIESVHWPKTLAKLTSSSLTYTTKNSGSRSYAPIIHYEFTVSDVKYSGSSIDFSHNYSSKTIAQKKLDTLRKMRPFQVYYQPKDPNNNVIYPGKTSTQSIRIIIGALLIILPLLLSLQIIELSS